MYAGPLSPEDKQAFLDRSARVWNADKVATWRAAGVDLVIGERHDYVLHDIEGRRLIDLHLNGGTFNLGHRNPELVGALVTALETFDMGNHHFPSLARTALAEALLETCARTMRSVVFSTGGSEAVDVAIKSVRRATGRRRIVSLERGYHGHTGLSICAGDVRTAEAFLVDRPDEFTRVPFNDVAAMEAALQPGDVAGVILETIPATYGFPLPDEGYLPAVKALCEQTGAKYIADEVQTGLLRSGEMWAIHRFGVTPDVLVSAKGLGGGLYPLGATVLDDECGAWLDVDGWGHVSTGGGAELGCMVGLKVLEITRRPGVAALAAANSARFAQGLAELQERFPQVLTGVRQVGLILGLEFAGRKGAQRAMRAFYDQGVWAIFSTFDPSVLQFKPGLLMTPDLVTEVLERVGAALEVMEAR
jgi:putrescine aminotransferase